MKLTRCYLSYGKVSTYMSLNNVQRYHSLIVLIYFEMLKYLGTYDYKYIISQMKHNQRNHRKIHITSSKLKKQENHKQKRKHKAVEALLEYIFDQEVKLYIQKYRFMYTCNRQSVGMLKLVNDFVFVIDHMSQQLCFLTLAD